MSEKKFGQAGKTGVSQRLIRLWRESGKVGEIGEMGKEGEIEEVGERRSEIWVKRGEKWEKGLV